MAQIISDTLTIRFSTLVRDGEEVAEGILLSDDDLEMVQNMIDTLDKATPGRVVELDLGEE